MLPLLSLMLMPPSGPSQRSSQSLRGASRHMSTWNRYPTKLWKLLVQVWLTNTGQSGWGGMRSGRLTIQELSAWILTDVICAMLLLQRVTLANAQLPTESPEKSCRLELRPNGKAP